MYQGLESPDFLQEYLLAVFIVQSNSVDNLENFMDPTNISGLIELAPLIWLSGQYSWKFVRTNILKEI